jgi:sterol desaturase/sphingolipid hydroxylase (fatty acid hydroxylase superfamily)
MDHAYGIPWEVITLPILAAWSVLMIALERRFPYDKGQKIFRVGFFTDFFWYTLVQGYVMGLLISSLIRVMPWRLHFVSSWPIILQLAFFWVTHDLYIYCFHRLQHRSKILWRTHEAHHSVKHVDWLAGSRSHPLEILINQTIEYAPIVILGAHPDVAFMKGILDATWGMYIHSNIGVRTRWLQYFVNGPEMHRWHHSAWYTGTGFNFATKIAIWDWIFGTAYLPPEGPKAYGLSDEPRFPEESTRASLVTTYWKQIVYAFRRPSADAAMAVERPRRLLEGVSGDSKQLVDDENRLDVA